MTLSFTTARLSSEASCRQVPYLRGIGRTTLLVPSPPGPPAWAALITRHFRSQLPRPNLLQHQPVGSDEVGKQPAAYTMTAVTIRIAARINDWMWPAPSPSGTW